MRCNKHYVGCNCSEQSDTTVSNSTALDEHKEWKKLALYWERQCEHAKSDLAALQSENDRLKQRMLELEHHNGEHGCGVAEVANERDQLKAELAQAKDGVAHLKGERDRFHEKNREIAAKRDQLKRELHELGLTLKLERDKNEALARELEYMRSIKDDGWAKVAQAEKERLWEATAHRTTSEHLSSERERSRKMREALEKLRDGPGNNMIGWQATWAHKFASSALGVEPDHSNEPTCRGDIKLGNACGRCSRCRKALTPDTTSEGEK